MTDKSYLRRLKLNSAIFKNKYWVLPVDDVGHENFEPVGRGLPSSSDCGKHVGYSICRNIKGHEGVSLGGVNFTGKVVVRHRHWWCKNSSCPVCFIRGWSVRRAGVVLARVAEGSRRGLGKIEHIVVSVAVADRDLPEKVFRKRCRRVLLERGVIGGCMIFHGYRVDRNRQMLVWSPHYHVLGFVLGGYARCRDCPRKFNCDSDCDGFDSRAWKLYNKDGYYVKVLRERKTVFGTAFYQANHATKKLGIGRFHIVTWFGECGNRKYSSKEPKSENTCPVCSSEMKRSAYVGEKYIEKSVASPAYKPVLAFDEFDGDGAPNFIDREGGY